VHESLYQSLLREQLVCIPIKPLVALRMESSTLVLRTEYTKFYKSMHSWHENASAFKI